MKARPLRNSLEDVQRIARGERKRAEPFAPRPQRTPQEQARVEAEISRQAFGIEEQRFWADFDRLLSDEECDEFYSRPVAMVKTGVNECPLCLREIESGENWCERCGPFLYADEPGYESWRGR